MSRWWRRRRGRGGRRPTERRCASSASRQRTSRRPHAVGAVPQGQDVGFASGEVPRVGRPNLGRFAAGHELFLGELADRRQHRKPGMPRRAIRHEQGLAPARPVDSVLRTRTFGIATATWRICLASKGTSHGPRPCHDRGGSACVRHAQGCLSTAAKQALGGPVDRWACLPALGSGAVGTDRPDRGDDCRRPRRSLDSLNTRTQPILPHRFARAGYFPRPIGRRTNC